MRRSVSNKLSNGLSSVAIIFSTKNIPVPPFVLLRTHDSQLFKARRRHDSGSNLNVHNPPADRAGELFKPFKDPENLVVFDNKTY